MTLSLFNKRILRAWQTLFVSALLFVQSSGAVLASTHAASENSRYLCGNGYIPPEAIANIKALLALQGDFDEDASTACDISCGVVTADTYRVPLEGTFSTASTTAPAAPEFLGRIASTYCGAPVGLRAPPHTL